MFPNTLKKIVLSVLILLSLQYKSQLYSVDELDSINNLYWDKGEVAAFLKFNLEMQKKYEAANNIDGIVNTSIGLGGAFTHLNRQTEALEYLDKAKENIGNVTNPLLISRLYNQYGELYTFSDLYKESNKSLDKAIEYAKKINDKKKKDKRLSIANLWKWYNFNKLGMMDSAYAIQRRSLKNFSDNPLVYEKIASEYISKKKHLDSAEYYLNRALPLVSGTTAFYNKGLVNATFGDLFVAKGEGDKALPYYFQSLDIFKKTKNKFVEKEIYNRISKAYQTKNLNDSTKAEYYYKKYSYLNDSISTNEKKVLGAIVEKLVQEKEDEQQHKTILYAVISAIIVLSLILLFFIRKAYLTNQRKKDRIIRDSFEEVMQLVKTNDPFFLTRFKEVYPEFYQKLINHQPNLTEHDIKFCAYIRLNLNSKEIAQYDNIAIRSVESKKYRLKKKLELSTETDLTKWILEL